MDPDTEEIRETHNLYIENTYGSLKNIIKKLIYLKKIDTSIILFFGIQWATKK